MAMPVFSSECFSWSKGRGTTSLTRIDCRDFPNQFYIKSAKTGEKRLFLRDQETMAENEFFDGEATAYFVPGGFTTVQIWC